MRPLVSNLIGAVMACLLVGLVTGAAVGTENAAIFPQLGNSSAVTAFAFSYDGKLLASGGYEGPIVIWDTRAQRQIRTLRGTVYPELLLFAPRNQLIELGGGFLTFWDLARGSQSTPTGNGKFMSPITSAALTRDGRLLAYGDQQHKITLWDLSSRKVIASWTAHDDEVGALSFSHDGKILASGSGSTQNPKDCSIKLWNVADGTLLVKVGELTTRVSSITFSPNGKFIASGSDKGVTVWSSKGGSIRSLTANYVSSVAISDDGAFLAAAEKNLAARVWDLSTGQEMGEELNLNRAAGPAVIFAAQAIAFEPGTRRLATGSSNGSVDLWSVSPQKIVDEIKPVVAAPAVGAVAVSSERGLIASGDDSGAVTVRSLTDGRTVIRITRQGPAITGLAFVDKGLRLISSSGDGTIDVCDTNTWSVIKQLSIPLPYPGAFPQPIWGMAVSSSGTRIAGWSVSTMAGRNHVVVWDATSGSRLFSWDIPLVASLAISPDGTTLAVGTNENKVVLLDTNTGAQTQTFTGEPPVGYSPNGREMLVSRLERQELSLIDAKTGAFLRAMSGTGDIRLGDRRPIAFSKDGQAVVSITTDNGVVAAQTQNGQQIAGFSGHDGSVRSVGISDDRTKVFSAGDDGSTRVWDVATGRMLAELISFTDGSSITVTPEGFFDSSSIAAEDNLNVRIGDRVFGISAFRSQFYRPALVKKALAGEPIAQYGSIDRVKLAPRVDFAAMPSTTDKASIEIKVTFTNDGGGFGPVTVFRNGASVTEDDNVPATGESFTRTYKVPLFHDRNDISVLASNADGTMASNTQTTVWANLPAPEKLTSAKGTLHAVIVGIKDFPNNPDPQAQLKFPVDDARLIYKTLNDKNVTGAVFDAVDIKPPLVTPEQTDKTHVLDALKAIAPQVGPNDTFVFYVASHGVVKDNEYYLITSNVDADSRHLKSQAISGTELVRALNAIPAANKLVILDTCDSGALTEALLHAAGNGGLDAPTAFTLLGNNGHLTVLAATTAEQDAAGGYKGHGILSWVINDGLTGNAADTKTGVVTNFSLADYVKNEVPIINHRQTPTPVKGTAVFDIAKVR